MQTNFSSPPEIVLPRESAPDTRRKLILRNPTDRDLVVKLIVPPSIVAERLAYRIRPRTFIAIEYKVNSPRAGVFEAIGHSLRGYVVPSYKRNLEKWLSENKSHKKSEEAFNIPIRFRNEFSAPQTVIDLPGRAALVESIPTPMAAIDEDDVKTACAVDFDVESAHQFGSMTNVAVNLRNQPKSCWLTTALSNAIWSEPKPVEINVTDKKKKNVSANSCGATSKKARRSNTDLNVTPCGSSPPEVDQAFHPSGVDKIGSCMQRKGSISAIGLWKAGTVLLPTTSLVPDVLRAKFTTSA
ncbi:unnamed protein product [Caenorhabditis auriculariae]|uniref:Major sperm protein n=1 Tax=Caenorhabditis auriculariae TaxID=2777116 RepID=A0A8S1HUZ5_9PELO|nr:unnamed protein product [Caenorhabditis auriculariae]